jgi:hypothetical protein
MQKLLAAVSLVATFASAAGRPIELPTSASASFVGDPGRLEVARGGGMGGGGFRPAVGGMGTGTGGGMGTGTGGGMGTGTGGGMMNSGGGMGFMGPGMNSGGVVAGPRDTKCAHHHAQSKNSLNPLNPLSWLSQCAK